MPRWAVVPQCVQSHGHLHTPLGCVVGLVLLALTLSFFFPTPYPNFAPVLVPDAAPTAEE